MAFKAAKCPNCAGDLQLPDDRDNVKCMYCGSDIIVREAIKAAAGGVNIENLIMLAKSAEKAKRNDEAYEYYSTVLEHDPKNINAWIGKGFSHWDRYTPDKQSKYVVPDIECFRTAIEHASTEGKQQEIKQYITQKIIQRTLDWWGKSMKAQNIYECILTSGVLPHVYSDLQIIHEFDPINDIGLISLGFNRLLISQFTEALEYFHKALSATTQKALVTDIIVASLSGYQYLIKEPSQRQHVFEFLERIKPGAGKQIHMEHTNTKKQCFIATAAYGSPMAFEVRILRTFRDEYLEATEWGKAFIKYYYLIGSHLARLIDKNQLLRACTRQLLKPVLFTVKKYYRGNKP